VQPPPDPCASKDITTLPKPNRVASAVPAFQKCLGRLAANAITIYRQLDPFVAPDSRIPDGNPEAGDLNVVQSDSSDFLER